MGESAVFSTSILQLLNSCPFIFPWLMEIGAGRTTRRQPFQEAASIEIVEPRILIFRHSWLDAGPAPGES